MIAPDSSVLIAGDDPEHPAGREARRSLARVKSEGRLVAHTLAETYAVLTAAAYMRPADHVSEYLGQFLARPPIGVPPSRYPQALAEVKDAQIIGGAIYDALIAIAARDAGARLISLDRRAARTYERCGVEYSLLG